MEHLSSPEQLQEHYHQAVELAYIVADTLSVASLKQLWEHSDFSTLDKQMLQMLRRGVDTVKEKTADALVAEMHTTREQATQSLVKYEPHKVSALAPLFRKRLDKMRKLFAIPQVRQLYFSEFHQRKDHREILANGKEGLEQVRAVEQEIQETKKQRHLLMVEKFFTGVKMSDVEKSTINEELVELEETLQTLHTKKHTLLQMRETATLWRLEKLKKMKRKDGYVMTPTRQSIFNIAVDQFLEGNHILLKGDTGTGKTAIAIQISKYLEELSAGKIQTLQIDGKKLEAEAKDPEKLRKAEQLVFSGNPFTTQSDLIGKDKLKGTIEMEFQYSKLLTAFMTGRVLILDELDSIP
ncbi:MAG: RuvB-like helicase [Candidatus Peribacteria bacterium]|jgi:DNA replication protein DnaC|nr:RuvB-like helicase [Candidatus Peribacteria bacterium]